MLGAIFFISTMAAFLIFLASGPTRKDKRRYLLNAFCLISLAVVGITAGSINPAPPKAALTASDKSSAAATTPPKNTPPNASTTPFADMLKKYGFEAMPPNCKDVSLSDLDSCLAKVRAELAKKRLNPGQDTAKVGQNAGTAMQTALIGDSSWLTKLPEEYLFACFESDRSRCSTSITHLKYHPKQNVLLETLEFQDYFQDTDKKFKPSPGRWHAICPLHPKDGHWVGQCTYKLLWPEEGKPTETVCTLTMSEEITELTQEGMVSGMTGKIDWTPRHDTLSPMCPGDSGKKKEFHLVPKQ